MNFKKLNFSKLSYITASLLYAALIFHLPVSLYTAAGHDDALFWSHAQEIINGNWLGNYSNMTLAKGAFFPIFLAANYFFGTSIVFTLILLNIISRIIFIKSLAEFKINKLFLFIIFSLILFHPQLFPTRIIRDVIVPPIILIILALLIDIILLDKNKPNKPIFIGILMGILWLTREDMIWVVPGLAIISLARVIVSFSKNIYSIKQEVRRYSLNLLIMLITFFTIPLSIALINKIEYGSFETVDFKSSSFSDAVNVLFSIEPKEYIQYLPVPNSTLDELYVVSPSFAKLKDFFNGPGKVWQQPGCAIYPSTCGGYAAGWFLWAFRDGVASLGLYDSPDSSATYYKSVAKEIAQACNSGRLVCKPSQIPLMPRISYDDFGKQFFPKIISAIKTSLVLNPVLGTAGPSMDPLEDLNKTREFLGNPRTTNSPSEAIVRIRGWYHSKSGNWISLKCLDGDNIIVKPISRNSSPDLFSHFGDEGSKNQRFNFEIKEKEDCKIINPIDNGYYQISPYGNKYIKSIEIGGGTLYIDSIYNDSINKYKFALNIKKEISKIYKYLIIELFFLGLISIIFLSILKITKNKFYFNCFLFILSIGLWVLFASRILLLVLVDITSFPAIDQLYINSGFIIIILSSVLSIATILTIKKIN